jgi:hypothetical protein
MQRIQDLHASLTHSRGTRLRPLFESTRLLHISNTWNIPIPYTSRILDCMLDPYSNHI